MRTRTRRMAGVATLTLGAASLLGGIAAAPAVAAETREVKLGVGNVTCLAGQGGVTGLGYAYEAKYNDAPSGTVSVTVPAEVLAVYPGLEIEITDAGPVEGVFTLSWNATQGDAPAPVISAVILKQADDAVIYTYVPPAASGTDLHIEGIAQSGGMSHVSFCLDDPPTTTTVPEETTVTTPTTAGTTSTTSTTTSTTVATTTTAQVLGTTLVREAASTSTTGAQVLGVQLPRTGGGDGELALLGLGFVLIGAGAVCMADDWRRLVARKA